MVSESNVLRKIFASRNEGVTRKWRRIHSDWPYDFL